MGAAFRARVKGGLLEPLERADLPEGAEVLLAVVGPVEPADDAAFFRSAGSWEGSVVTEALIRDIYADRRVQTRPEPKL